MAYPALVVFIALGFFVVLLVFGRQDITRGANAEVARGAVYLTLAAIVGTLALSMVLSLVV